VLHVVPLPISGAGTAPDLPACSFLALASRSGKRVHTGATATAARRESPSVAVATGFEVPIWGEPQQSASVGK